jgi:hypothetical protein
MIRIVIDTSQLTAANNKELFVKDWESYVKTRDAIRSALENGKHLDIIITNTECAAWFWDLDGHPEIQIVNRRPSSILAKKIDISPDTLPDELSDKDIIELGLLEKEPPLEPLETIPDIIVAMVCGVAWAMRSPSWEHLRLLAESCLRSKGRPEVPRDWIKKRISENASRWIALARGTLRDTYEKLLKRPMENSQLIAVAVRLGHTQSYIWKILDDLNENILDLRNLTSRTELLNLRELSESLPLLDNRFAYYITNLLRKKGLEAAIRECSGLFLSELEALENYLHSRTELPTCREIDTIRIKFQDCPGAEPIMDRLSDLIPPPLPREPSRAWGWSEWKSWLIGQYLKYSFHCHKKGYSLGDSASYGERFAEWLWENFPKLLVQGDPLVINVCGAVRSLLADGHIVILLIVDGLGWQWIGFLLKAFEQHNYRPVKEATPLISMIPTDTEISKPCILGGCRADEALGSEEELLQSQFPNKTVTYTSNLEAFRKSFSDMRQLYCCHFRDLDELFHQHHESPRILSKKAEQCFQLLASEITETIKGSTAQSRIRIVIVGDHGSVNLRLFNKLVQLPSDLPSDQVSDSRFLPVLEHEVANLQGYYVLRSVDYGLPRSYAVAQGYSAIERSPHGYAHGGLSPEESIVPLAILETSISPKTPFFELGYDGRTIRRGRVESIIISVKNLTRWPLRYVRVRFPDIGSEVQIDEIPVLEEKHSLEPCPIRIGEAVRIESSKCSIPVVVEFTSLGRPYTHVVSLGVKVVQFQEFEPGGSIEDLL